MIPVSDPHSNEAPNTLCAVDYWQCSALGLLLTLALPGNVAKGQDGDGAFAPNRTLAAETPLPSITSTMAELQPPTQPNRELAEMPSPLPSGILEPLAPGLDTSFAGVNFDNNATYNSGYVFIPPDPIATTGLTHVASVVNAMIEWRPKSGAVGTIQSLKGFFTSLTPANALFDPKMIYDQYADRFIVVALEKVDPPTTSRILVAVSKTSDPTADWWFSAINAKISISGTDYWADYPGLGLDDKAIYIAANLFTSLPMPPAAYGCGSSTKRLSTPVGSRRSRYTTRMWEAVRPQRPSRLTCSARCRPIWAPSWWSIRD